MKTAFLLGRAVFGGFFLYNGINHLKSKEQMTQYASYKGVPNAEAGVVGSGILLAIGGASLILGVKPKWGSAALIGFLAVASAMMHDFWNDEDAQAQQNNLIHFSKNAALLGAALALAGVEEPWPASLGKGK
jgi:putative oxidoreductase